MRTLYKTFLLAQLITLPFAVGMLHNILGGSDKPITTDVQAAQATAVTHEHLCDVIKDPAMNAVQDDVQQLKYITGELYEQDVIDDCSVTPTPVPTP